MKINDILNIIVIALYVIAISTAIFMLIKSVKNKKKWTEDLKNGILNKIKSGIEVSAIDVNVMSRATGLSQKSVSECISQLLLVENDKETYEKIRILSTDFNKIEPYENLPDEVKPSLMRIQELIEASNRQSDMALLNPIQRNLASYAEQKNEYDANKKRSKWFNFITIIGFVVGIIGLYFTLNTPDSKDIEKIINKAIIEKNIQSEQ